MPAILLRFLPHGLIVLAVLGGVWFIYHSGEQRQKQRDQFERAVAGKMHLEAIRRIEAAVADKLATIDATHTERVTQLQTVNRTIIQPTLTKEVASNARFSDPAAGLSDGLREAINTARDLSCNTTIDGGVVCPVLAAGEGSGQ